MTARGNRLGTALREARRPRQRCALLVTIVAAAALSAAAPLATVVSDGSIGPLDLLVDPAEVTGAPWYLGAISTANLHVWAVAGALYALVGVGGRHRDRRLANASLWLAALTLVVLLDDQLLLHEIVVPWLLGVPELVAFAAYGTAITIIVLRYHRVLLEQPEVVLLVLAVVALATSVALDVVGWDTTTRRFAEEACKLLGALAWAAFPATLLLRWLSAPSPPAGSR